MTIIAAHYDYYDYYYYYYNNIYLLNEMVCNIYWNHQPENSHLLIKNFNRLLLLLLVLLLFLKLNFSTGLHCVCVHVYHLVPFVPRPTFCLQVFRHVLLCHEVDHVRPLVCKNAKRQTNRQTDGQTCTHTHTLCLILTHCKDTED